MARLDLPQGRHRRAGLLDGEAASRLERTRARRSEHVARGALDRGQRLLAPRVETRDRLEEAEGVGVARAGKELLGRAGLHEHPCIHHVDALAHAGDDAEVVRDEDERRVLVGDEVSQKAEDLCLNRDVESGGGLVRDQELGLAREGHRDHGALAHAARELVRVVLEPQLGARDADAVEKLGRALLGLLLGEVEVRLEGLADLPPDGEHRVQARHRVLEDHRDVAAADLPQLGVRKLEKVAVLEHRRARGDLAGAREDAEEREGGDALAAAGLADDPECLARRDVERDPVDGVDGSPARPELDVEVLDREERLAAGLHRERSLGSSASRSPSPMRLKPSTVSTIAIPGTIARWGPLTK